jgi:hypothetical protein
MKTKDLAMIGSAALVTATLTVAAFLPNSLNAGDDTAPEEIARPKLVSNGVEFTLATVESQTFKAGDEPAFDLKAVNTTGKDVDAAVLVSMTAMAPSSKFSRMPAFPQMLWQKSCPLTLKPNETKIIPLTTCTKLPPNSMINVKLQPLDPQNASANEKANGPMIVKINDTSAIVAVSFSTLPPAPAATLAPN